MDKQITISEETYNTLKDQILAEEKKVSEANLSGADLRGADLSGADITGANLSKADLSGADLHCATFFGKDGTTKINKDQVNDFFDNLKELMETFFKERLLEIMPEHTCDEECEFFNSEAFAMGWNAFRKELLKRIGL